MPNGPSGTAVHWVKLNPTLMGLVFCCTCTDIEVAVLLLQYNGEQLRRLTLRPTDAAIENSAGTLVERDKCAA